MKHDQNKVMIMILIPEFSFALKIPEIVFCLQFAKRKMAQKREKNI